MLGEPLSCLKVQGEGIRSPPQHHSHLGNPVQRTPATAHACSSAAVTRSARRSGRHRPTPWSSLHSMRTRKFWSSASSILWTSASLLPIAFLFNFQLRHARRFIGTTFPVRTSGPAANVKSPPVESPWGRFAWDCPPIEIKTTSVHFLVPGSLKNWRCWGAARTSETICCISRAV